MNHAITLGGLLLFLGVIGGLGTTAFGVLMFLAGGMSDAPAEGEKVGKQGCVTASIGLAVFIASLWGLLS